MSVARTVSVAWPIEFAVYASRSVWPLNDGVTSAAREGARQGVRFDTPNRSNRFLVDSEIKAVVDAELVAVSLPTSILKNPTGTTCPASTDGNAFHNPPYASAAYPPAANQPWLYICYANTPGLDYPLTPATNLSQQDLNVIVLYSYGPLTPLVTAQFGIFKLAVNEHMTVQG